MMGVQIDEYLGYNRPVICETLHSMTEVSMKKVPHKHSDERYWIEFADYFRLLSPEEQSELRQGMSPEQKERLKTTLNPPPPLPPPPEEPLTLDKVYKHQLTLENKLDKIGKQVGCLFAYLIFAIILMVINSL